MSAAATGEPRLRGTLAKLAAVSEENRVRLLRGLGEGGIRTLAHQWEGWAHDGQIAPPGDWRVWLLRGGRGFGKTMAGAQWISRVARGLPRGRIALVGATERDVARVMVEGESGLIACAHAGETFTWRRDKGVFTFHSGAEAFVYSAASPEGLRGPEHHAAWCDELGKWHGDAGAAAWDNLLLGLRLGEGPRVLVTTTPRPTALMRRLMAMPGLVQSGGGTRDNPHLPGGFVATVEGLYAGTRWGRQELDGEMVEDVEGALWPRALIEARRLAAPSPREAWERVVVGVDPPAGTAAGGGDACGIVAVARTRGGQAEVIEDASIAGASPEGWARAVAACAARTGADRVVAERNQGGEMVRSTLAAADAGLPVTLVHASRGKAARAEPVAALYEAGRAWHAGVFAALEEEMAGLSAGGGYGGPGRSPDRADALVWAMTELMLVRGRREARVRVL